MTPLQSIDERIRSVVAGRRWIVPVDAAAAASESVAQLRAWDATDVMVVAATAGVGDQPECDVVLTGQITGSSIMEGIRAFEQMVNHPTVEVVEALNRFDPKRAAWVAAGPFDKGASLLDRRLYGARHEAWAALEDKIAIRRYWEAAGIAMAPSEVVPVSDAPAAAARLATDAGTVWAADNSRGWHGGSEGTRWVGNGAGEMAAARQWAAEIAETVRVMPFLDGVPCSIHGYVTDTGLAVFRPIEMITFQTVDRKFRYGGLSSAWEAPQALESEMRTAARALGETLSDQVGYRGGFSIDGVATSEGFRPTEVNPRLSAGLGMQTHVAEGLPIGWMTACLVEGDLSVDHVWLEEQVLETARTKRTGRLTLALFEPVEDAKVRIAFSGGSAFVPEDEEESVATLEVGPGPAGPVLFMRFDTEHLPFGERMAAYALAAAELASKLWGFALEEMSVAPDQWDGERTT